MKPTVVRLPDLKDEIQSGEPPPLATGWFALGQHDEVSVPTLEQARRCARVEPSEPDPCEPRVVRFDPPDGVTIIALAANDILVISVELAPGLPDEVTPALVIRSADALTFEVELAGAIVGPCRDELAFSWTVPALLADGLYELFVKGYEKDSVFITLAVNAPPVPADRPEPCALTLVPHTRRVGIALETTPAVLPRAPLLAVDAAGCVVEAWSVDSSGRVLIPNGDDKVDLFASCRGGLIASLGFGPIQDAIFWPNEDVVAVLSTSSIRLFDLRGCLLLPVPFANITDGFALGISDDGFLLVISRSAPQVRIFRRDGSELLPPASFDGRGWYARHRNPAFVFDEVLCGYVLDPSRVGSGCCVVAPRPLTDEESLFFRLIDDFSELRKRVAYAPSGSVLIGPAEEEDPLDARRPGTQWHELVLFGEIPEGCAVRIETRAFDDILAGDPLVPDGWSKPVLAGPSSAVSVASPGDLRQAAADAMVLSGPGRYLWMRLTLMSDGRRTPRITAIEAEHPRQGIARFLPEVFQNSTPEDDFLRRWLSLFENTAFDGVALRMDQYAELFDPRFAPEALLPFLAEWLQILDLARLRENPDAFRKVLARAAELAQTRGTVEGLMLAAKLYLEMQVQIVESFKTRSAFILGCGTTIDGLTGPVLGCQTALSAEPAPIVLGDQPRLGCGFLLECEERTGTIPHHFDVRVPARQVCASEDLAALRLVIETEKPAHTTYHVRATGAAGWVLGVESVLGQELSPTFDRDELDPATYGIALGNGPPRPKPIGEGFALGVDSRLSAPKGQPALRIAGAGIILGQTSRVGAQP